MYGSYGLPNETFWDTIEQLPAGHFIELSIEQESPLTKNNIKTTKWYDFVNRVYIIETMIESELRSLYLKLLNESISLRFRADVKIGFNISGGLDSSVLLALVNMLFPKNESIEAFTFYSNNNEYDELPWVQQMISLTGNPLNKCLLKVEEIDSLINDINYFQDEPFGGFPTLAYSLIFKEAQRKNILVLLDGQGIDEAWGGYDYYQNNSRFNIQGTTTTPVKPEVLQTDFIKLAELEIYPEPFKSELQNLQYRDLFYTKIPRTLRFNDRISMMHSTELREPFLDYRLVELAFSQKDEVKIKNGKNKWLLREIAQDLLGKKIALAPKRPLQTPQREWISNELKEFVNEQINQFKTLDFVNSQKVSFIWKEYQRGNRDNSFYIWQWININKLIC